MQVSPNVRSRLPLHWSVYLETEDDPSFLLKETLRQYRYRDALSMRVDRANASRLLSARLLKARVSSRCAHSAQEESDRRQRLAELSAECSRLENRANKYRMFGTRRRLADQERDYIFRNGIVVASESQLVDREKFHLAEIETDDISRPTCWDKAQRGVVFFENKFYVWKKHIERHLTKVSERATNHVSIANKDKGYMKTLITYRPQDMYQESWAFMTPSWSQMNQAELDAVAAFTRR